MGGKGGAMGGQQANQSTTENGLQRTRYIECSEQVRRMPIAIGVVIDQAHIQDFLAAVANSPLRIQTTQWHWQRFYDDIKPADADAPPSTVQPTVPTAPAAPGAPTPIGQPAMGGKGGGKGGEMQSPRPAERDEGESGKRMQMGRPQQGKGFSPTPVPTPQAASPASAAAAEETEWDLVSLAVYGIASLYERYPPPDATAAAGTEGK
jgi:hypothetical protein